MLIYVNNIEYIMSILLVSKYILKLEMQKSNWRIVVSVIATVFATYIVKSVGNRDALIIILLVTIILVLQLMTKESMKTILLYTLAMFTSISVLVQMLRDLAITVGNMFGVILPNDLCEIIALTIIIGVVVGVSQMFGIRHGLKNVSFGYHILFNTIIVIDSVCISFLGGFIAEEIRADRKWIIELVYIFTVLGVFVQLGLLIAMILSRDEHKEKEALNAKYLEEQKNHYEYLKNRELETRKFRHDINQQMTLMKTLYREGKIEQFEEILDSIGDRINTFTKHVSVGNDTADAIINQYVQGAEKAGIKLSVEGRFPPDCHIAAVDICTVFANLLSNAIRAEKDANGDEVKLTVRNLDNELFVEVRNDYITEVKRNGERFMSTKKDRANHGLGLQNVYDSVERNHGVIHITTDNQIFDVKLNLKKTEAYIENSNRR